MPDTILQNQASSTLRRIGVLITDPAGSPLADLNQTKVTIKTIKPGLTAFSASSATLVEDTSSVGNGSYDLVFTAAEVDTLGDLKFEISSGSTAINRVLGYVTVISTATAEWTSSSSRTPC
jgi:archaellin